MQELSMNVLDIAQNSISARASLVEITVDFDDPHDLLTLIIKDDGCGMDEQTLKKVVDPFFTSRTTRKVGLGIPFLKMAAEQAEGSFLIESTPNVGTVVTATFKQHSIDLMPLGDMASSISTLIQCNPDVDFIYTLSRGSDVFHADSREMKEILNGVPISNPEVALFIREFVNENSQPILNKGA